MRDNNEKPINLPINFRKNDSAFSRIAFTDDTPEKIAVDILKTEKEMAIESLDSARKRYERERRQWEKIYEEKERELLLAKNQLNDAQDCIKKLKRQFEEERQFNLEQIKHAANELEKRQRADAKKWESVNLEVKSFRDEAQSAQKRYLNEIERLNRLKETFNNSEKFLREQIRIKEDEISALKEENLKKSEMWLLAKSEFEEKSNSIQAQLNLMQETLNSEKETQKKTIEKKNADITMFQTGLKNTIIQLNSLRQAKEELEEKNDQLQRAIVKLEDESKKSLHEKDKEVFELKKLMEEERLKWENTRQEFAARQDAVHKEAEEQITRTTKSMTLIEQEFSNEHTLRQEIENALSQKEQEVQRLVSEKNGLIEEWKKLLAFEQESSQKRQDEILAEYNRIKDTKDNEFANLKSEIREIRLSLAEENKLCNALKEENNQYLAKIRYFEEENRKLIEQLENKEKDWQSILMKEQEFLQKQIEELRAKSEAQIQSRDLEITRLNEDISILNGQLIELRQKFSLEKNENNNRLSRIQEFESLVKSLNERNKQERSDWEMKNRIHNDEMELNRINDDKYLENRDKQYKSEIEAYMKEIGRLNNRINSLIDIKKDNTSQNS